MGHRCPNRIDHPIKQQRSDTLADEGPQMPVV